jgi:hypothetical protein
MFSILLLLFQYKPVQTWAAKKAAGYLSEKLGTTVDIKGLYLQPFTSVAIDSLTVLDKQKDTLLNAPKLTVDINGFSLFSSISKKQLDLSKVEFDHGSFYLKKQKGGSNLQFIIDYFNSPDTTKPTTPSKPWQVTFEKVVFNGFHFRYKNMLKDTFMRQVNFDDVDLHNFSATIKNMDLVHHLFKGNVRNLSLYEAKSGFYLKKFNADATVDTNQILAQNLYVLTNHSSIKDYFRMKFKSFDDFDKIEERVFMDGDFKSSQISSSDIGYFTDGLTHTRFDLGINGRITGFVNNLRAKDLLITGGKATYVKGNFNLRGLPNWDNTFLDLDFEEIATNKADMDYLLANFSGTPTKRAPDILAKFGNINFNGRFTGLQNDFVAYGTFKTKLGRFDPDINLKINKAGVPSYSGKVDTYGFDLGNLIGAADLGRTTLTADVNGSGNALGNLNANLDAKVSDVQFKNYDYHALTINGSFNKKIATAKITIGDKNLNLDLNGSVNLNAALPAYDFTANINTAHLHDLKLLGDTVTFSTFMTAKFSGDNLNNLTGNLALRHSRVIDPRNNDPIDSVILSSTGSGNARMISLRSDVMDGYIKGSFDVPTLPDYFKSTLKKYIPSLQTSNVEPKPQNFAFNLTLKDPDPLIAVFKPGLKIPDQGTFIGQFNSEAKTADLNAYIKTIQLGKIVFHDFIIDENTTNDLLTLNLSLNKVNFSDSLFIKNITVVNTVRKDSVNFNVKLSDQNAVNSLDLYGLVRFGKDTTARLQLLPSDVMLERQDWRLATKVNIRLLNGKTEVSGFQLSNGQQKAMINGFISDDPADVLKVTFQKFNMNNLDQLTKSGGILLKGTLNGDVKLTSITNSPGVAALLGIDSLIMNKTLVGNVKIESNLGNDRKQADVKLNIHNHGLETMDIEGLYRLADQAAGSLDFNVKMNQTEAIIFAPFIKDLVSNIKGTVSTDLKLTGTASKPLLNGNVILANTGVTVNYLKTPYTISDTLNVANSVININRMTIKDGNKGTGIVTGKVDLTDMANPDIEATVDAKKLLALNTTFRDNHVYYGTAYATGRFGFSGPVDNMKIDIKAQTDAGTVFNIPLNTSSTVSDNDFITYVDHNKPNQSLDLQPKTFNGVTLNFDLTVDEKTTVKITTDYGVLEGSGQAKDLKLNINSLGDFEMFGDFGISTGKFEFTAKNFISKNFTVNQGGTIRWTGNPSNATINLNAIYEVRTDIAPLYQAAGSQSPKGHSLELVQADLILTKSLLQPVIDFDFNFPLDPSIKDDLSNYLSDVNNRSQQALSIIVRRQFSNGANNNLTNQVLGTAGEAVSEFAFNRLNSLIAQSNVKNFDLNIRSFNDASASFKIQDRFIMTGSLFSSTIGSSDLFTQSNSSFFNSSFNQLTKDFEAQYLIRKNGDLSAKYSYRVLNSTTLNTLYDNLSVEYVNGLGFVYQRDFDTFGEFWRNFFKTHEKQPIHIKSNPVPVPSTQTPAPAAPPANGSKPK